jgi:hypothetical protein
MLGARKMLVNVSGGELLDHAADRDLALQSRQLIPNAKLRARTKAKAGIIQPLQISDGPGL